MFLVIKRLLIIGVTWSVFAAITLVMIFLGVFMVGIALKLYGRQSNQWPKLFWPWGNDEEGYPAWTDVGPYRWYAIRNKANNMRFAFLKEPKVVRAFGSLNMEAAGFKWRYRYGGWMDSFRLTWGKAKPKKGKNELYVGFKIGSSVPGLWWTAQLRPAWLILVPIVLVWIYRAL